MGINTLPTQATVPVGASALRDRRAPRLRHVQCPEAPRGPRKSVPQRRGVREVRGVQRGETTSSNTLNSENRLHFIATLVYGLPKLQVVANLQKCRIVFLRSRRVQN